MRILIHTSSSRERCGGGVGTGDSEEKQRCMQQYAIFMKYGRHLKTILLHKWYVGSECFKRGMYWQGIVHDLSKFSYVEFFASAKYFQGDKTPIGAEKAERGYSYAWLNHKAKNKHHWEYWTDFYDGVIKPVPMPEKYIKEMACDMIGASKTYSKEKYYPNAPWEYFDKRRDSFIMEERSKKMLEDLLIQYTRV